MQALGVHYHASVALTPKTIENAISIQENARAMSRSEAPLQPPGGRLRVGIDLVQISRIGDSVERFGEKFLTRIFTADEIAYASGSPACRNERLAARFAAKEATMKALALTDRGVRWTDIEVMRAANGDVSLRLHGAAELAARARGVVEMALSVSHEGDYATAVVIAQS